MQDPSLDDVSASWTVSDTINLRRELHRAEVDGEITELYGLAFQAVLAMVEHTGFANDYLEMAGSVASSPHEIALVARLQEFYRLHASTPLWAAEQCIEQLILAADEAYQHMAAAACQSPGASPPGAPEVGRRWISVVDSLRPGHARRGTPRGEHASPTRSRTPSQTNGH